MECGINIKMEPFMEELDIDDQEINGNLDLSQNNMELEFKLEPIDPLECSHEVDSDLQLEKEQTSEENGKTVVSNTKRNMPIFDDKNETTLSNNQIIYIPKDVRSFIDNELKISKDVQSEDTVKKTSKKGRKSKPIRCSNRKKSKRLISIKPKLTNNECRKESSPKKLRNKKLCVPETNSRSISCKCGRKSSRPEIIFLHKLSFKEGKPFKCDKCMKMFSCFHYLSKHECLTVTHAEVKRYNCPECGKTFYRIAELKKHIKLHANVTLKPYQCDECEKSFSRTYHLKQHKMIHSGEKPFQCTLCEKSFSRSQTLIQHSLTHSSEKPFKCPKCDKSYVNTHQLKLHEHVHTGVKPHQCDVCSKSFTRPFDLKVHKTLHSGIKKFKCKICNKDFSRGYTLNKHMITSHYNEMTLF